VIIVSVVLVIALLFVGSQWVKPQSLKLTLNWHSLEFELQRQQSGDTPRAGSTAMIRPGEIAGSRPVGGILAAQTIKPQARTLAEDRGMRCVVLDYDALRGLDRRDLTLF
jgi:hypothetical protein